MPIDDIKKYLATLKSHVDTMDYFSRQVTNMIYAIEEKIMDIEDGVSLAETAGLEVAASKMYQLNDSPARLNSGRCSKDLIAAAGFYQSKKIV
jgi:hypothetical protein